MYLVPRSLECHDWTNLSVWQELIPCHAVQSYSRLFSWVFPPGADRLCVRLCRSVTVLYFSLGIPSPALGRRRAWRVAEAAAGRRGRKWVLAGHKFLMLHGAGILFHFQSRGLPRFLVAKLSDLDVATSGLCVASVRVLALMNCCSLFAPLF